MADLTEDFPDWWVENRIIKFEMDLPEYDPPRFKDGTYTHTLVLQLERELKCKILFIGIDAKYMDDWEIRIDDISVCGIEKHRTQEGNTVYEIGSERFNKVIREEMEDRDSYNE
tara:strand:- start:189 stop:530 length:342 start_codon:yes stop_codon:yes gene_type:complete